MKINLIIVLLLGFLKTLFSQGMIIGNVYYQSSGKKPAVGVKVNANGSNGDYTKTNGEYTLTFPHFSKGKTVSPFIGDKNSVIKDAGGQAIELVNEKSLEYFTIPEDPKVAPLKIIVCPKGFRDVAVQKYYNILKTSSDVALVKTKSELINLLTQKDQDNAKIAELTAVMANLSSQIDSVSLLKEAYSIASINKDDASERILRYIALLDAGKSVQEAREVLNIKSAAKDLNKNMEGFLAAIQELETRAGASASLFDYKDAIACYDTIVHYSEAMGINPGKIADYYSNAAYAIYNDGKFEKALEYEKKSLEIKEKQTDPDQVSLAISYNLIANLYRELGQLEEALVNNQKEVNIKEKNLDPKDLQLSYAYQSIGETFKDLGQYEKALEYCEKALEIQKLILTPDDSNLANAYISCANAYSNLREFDSALVLIQKAIAIQEKVKNAMDPILAISYNNLSTVYISLGQNENGLEYILKAMKIMEKSLDPKHLDLSLIYDNVANNYRNLKQYDKAIEYHYKAIKIKEENYSATLPALATSYIILAITLRVMEQYDKALEYMKKAIIIQEKSLEPGHPNLGISYGSIASIYKKMKLYPEAIAFVEKAIPIMNAAFPENHPYVKQTINLRLDCYYAKGLSEFEGKLYSTALSDFHVVTSARDSSNDWNYTGLCYYKLNDFPKAIAAFQKTAVISPEIKNQFYYSNIGMAYAKNKQINEAKIAFQEYEKLFPNDGVTLKNWAIYYASQKEKDKAILNLEKAIQLNYNDLSFLKEEDSFDFIRNEAAFIKLCGHLEELKIKN